MLQFAHGAVQWLTTQALNTVIPVTGSTFASGSATGQEFEPKAIRFYWTGIQSNRPTALITNNTVSERRGVGFAASAASRASVGSTSTQNSGNANCGSIFSNTACVVTVTDAGVLDGLLDINTFNSGGFTLIVDDVAPQNITVFWEAWGGDEITNVTVGSIAEPAATGLQSYTATGFVANPINGDQCVMFAGVQSVSAAGTGEGQDSGLHVGFSTGTATGSNITLCGNSDDGSATMDTDGYNYTGECLSMITIAGGNPNARAVLSAYGTNTFTLDWRARNNLNRRSIYMAIKGGEWSAGSTTIAGNTLNSTTTVGDFPFNVRGVSLLGSLKTISTIATSTGNDRITFGSGISPTFRNSASSLDFDNIPTSAVQLAVNYAQVLVYPTTASTAVFAAYDINNLKANSFQLITDTAGGVANEWIGYLAFGDRKPRTVSIGHPFIN